MTQHIGRRTLLASAAWSIPAIALAVGVPAASASAPEPDYPVICNAYPQDNGTFYVYDDRVVIEYLSAPDIYEINIRYADGTTQSFGTNFGSAPARGSTSWAVPLRSEPEWIQVHGFNTHLGETCFLPVKRPRDSFAAKGKSPMVPKPKTPGRIAKTTKELDA